MDEGDDLLDGVPRARSARIEGAHAIVVLCRAREPGRILAARVGNAGGVVIGYGDGEMFVASDLPALLPETQRVAFLDDGEIACVTPDGATYVDVRRRGGRRRQPQHVPFDPVSAAKGAYKHFMLKEIMEQPECVMDTFRGRAIFEPPGVELEDLRPERRTCCAPSTASMLIGMGTSMHAAMVGRTYFERIAGIPAEVDNSSEFRYRDALIGAGDARHLGRAVGRDGRHAGGDGRREARAARRSSRSATRRARSRRASPTASCSRAAGRRSRSRARRR